MTVLTRRDLRRLMLLARRDRTLVRAWHGTEPRYEICDSEGPFANRSDCERDEAATRIGEGWVREAEQREWIERIDGDRWALTKRGRATLKAGKALLEATASTGNVRKARPEAPGGASDDLAERAGTVLGWLRKRVNQKGEPLISEAEVAAGARFRSDFFRANSLPQTTARLSLEAEVRSPSAGADNGLADRMDRLVQARERVMRALAAVGPELGEILIDTCCHERGLTSIESARGWPQRSAKVVLTIALRQLAEHYGYATRHGGDGQGHPRA
jgi:hypothetical protein